MSARVDTSGRLTPHQRDTFMRLARFSAMPDLPSRAWVAERYAGGHATLWRLVRKGLAEALEVQGPRGGTSWRYRLTDAGLARYEQERASEVR